MHAINRFWFALAAFVFLGFNCLCQPKRAHKHTYRPNKIDSVAILGASPDSILVWDILDTIRARRFPDRPRSEYPKRGQYKPGLAASVPADWVRIADSLGVQKITKADFDGDGLTDMIRLAGGPSDLTGEVILDDGGNRYRVAPLDKSYMDVAFPLLHYDDGKAEILYYNFPTRDFYINFAAFQGAPLVLRMDTLVYYKGAFVEKNTHPKAYRIEHIQYITQGCMEGRCTYNLAVDSAGKAVFVVEGTYEDSSGKGLSGTYSAVISQHSLQDIYSTLRYIDFPQLNDAYRATLESVPGGTIIITYDGGKTKQIDDGGVGTNGLALLHDQLMNLQLTQKWMKIDVPGK